MMVRTIGCLHIVLLAGQSCKQLYLRHCQRHKEKTSKNFLSTELAYQIETLLPLDFHRAHTCGNIKFQRAQSTTVIAAYIHITPLFEIFGKIE